MVDPSRVMTVRGLEASEGSTPSVTFRTGAFVDSL
nr:MAG TPA: hypothetical protein [Caudoviricetes sp.]